MNDDINDGFDSLNASIVEDIENNLKDDELGENEDNQEATEQNKEAQDQEQDKETSSSDDATEENVEEAGDEQEIGVSDAYGFNKKKKEETPAQKSKDKILPPDLKKFKTDGKESNIWKVFWDEFIIPAYAFCIDVPTDAAIGFLNYWLYETKKSKEEPKKDKETSETVLDYGQEVYQQYVKNISDSRDMFDKTHAEIMANIGFVTNGMKPVWKVCPEEPDFFNRMVKNYKKAQTDPNCPEAKVWKRFENAPKTMKIFENNEKITRFLAIKLATLDEVISGNDKSADKKEEIKKRIDDKSQDYYAHIRENLEKIKQAYADDPSKQIQITADYIKHIKQSIDKAEPHAEKYLTSKMSRFGTKAKAWTGNVVKSGAELLDRGVSDMADKASNWAEKNKPATGLTSDDPIIESNSLNEKLSGIVGKIAGHMPSHAASNIVDALTPQESIKRALDSIDTFSVEKKGKINDLRPVTKTKTSPFQRHPLNLLKGFAKER